jgi:quercetin dioxygenase-like cupin family protein
MPFTVYDYRNPDHIRNLLVTPEMRSRILKMEPGQGFNARHSHDLGHEVFLILQGEAEFEIDGETKTVGPGQLCFARIDQPHSVRVVSEEPVIMYLSVTPHILPTHTGRTADGEAKPIRFSPPGSYDVDLDPTVSQEGRIARHRSAVESLGSAVRALADSHRATLDQLAHSDAHEDIREEMWTNIYKVFKSTSELADSWNDLAYTLSDS